MSTITYLFSGPTQVITYQSGSGSGGIAVNDSISAYIDSSRTISTQATFKVTSISGDSITSIGNYGYTAKTYSNSPANYAIQFNKLYCTIGSHQFIVSNCIYPRIEFSTSARHFNSLEYRMNLPSNSILLTGTGTSDGFISSLYTKMVGGSPNSVFIDSDVGQVPTFTLISFDGKF